MVNAARILGKDSIAAKYAAELDKLRNPNGLIGVWMIGPEGAGWPLDFRWPHATPISFDIMGRNPFELDVPDAVPSPQQMREALSRLIKNAG